MADKLDPFDVAALERSLNDSAVRVSTIWVSFLIFSLYLLIAAATVEHRQLFLAEPVKLPVLNIDLPLWGFFFLAPILFVIFHIYVLMQVLLLGRTAAAYNEAVEQADLTPEENASLRQRLANTLFAQIFAGAPREREGWLGWLLKAMAWITLAIAPILILLVFQFMFLPYHSHLATWTHRLLIVAELAVAFMFWPLVLDARRDFTWTSIWMQIKRTTAIPLRLLGAKDRRYDEWVWLRQQAVALVSCVLFVLVSLLLATFPGEPHLNLLTGHPPFSVQCTRWFGDLRFDRLVLPSVDVVDDEKLSKIVQATSGRQLQTYEGEWTQNFRNRDLKCAEISSADLRRVNLTRARMTGATLRGSDLQGARLDGAELGGADLEDARLQGASLNSAELQGASLNGAQMQGSVVTSAGLQGAFLTGAQMQGSELIAARLQGARLSAAQLQGADLRHAQLQGTSMILANLQGASLEFTDLQGAIMSHTRLQGASFKQSQLQGASLIASNTAHAVFSDIYVWQTILAECKEAHVSDFKSAEIINIESSIEEGNKEIQATPDNVKKFIEQVVGEIPNQETREQTREQMQGRFVPEPDDMDDMTATLVALKDCKANPPARFDNDHAEFLRQLVCEAIKDRNAIAKGVIKNWISDDSTRREFSIQLASGLLGEDGKLCAATKDLDFADRERLREFAPAPTRM